MAAVTEMNLDPRTTWVERQHERLEEASDTTPAHLQLEDGVGAAFGGAVGFVVGLVLAGAVVAMAAPVEAGAAALVLAVGALLGLVAGSIAGGILVGRQAHAAEAEFADLRARARREAPVQPTGSPAPMPVEQGGSVFGPA